MFSISDPLFVAELPAIHLRCPTFILIYRFNISIVLTHTYISVNGTVRHRSVRSILKLAMGLF